MRIAWGRKGSLRAALRAKAAVHARFADAADRLDRFAAWAGQMPFAFYARVLAADGGRRRFLARLGHEADDALDEFLNLALDYERRETPSLQGFVAWLRTAQTDVKRDMEITRDEVRVMTVHGAKGLEAPIVVLADTTTPPAGPAQRQPRLLALPADSPGAPDRLVWARARASDVTPVSAAREQARREAADEHRRLLYVAMTRAIDRLVVCGAEGERKRPEGCWWNLVFDALRLRSPWRRRPKTATARCGAIAGRRRHPASGREASTRRRHRPKKTRRGSGRMLHANTRPSSRSRPRAPTTRRHRRGRPTPAAATSGKRRWRAAC